MLLFVFAVSWNVWAADYCSGEGGHSNGIAGGAALLLNPKVDDGFNDEVFMARSAYQKRLPLKKDKTGSDLTIGSLNSNLSSIASTGSHVVLLNGSFFHSSGEGAMNFVLDYTHKDIGGIDASEHDSVRSDSSNGSTILNRAFIGSPGSMKQYIAKDISLSQEGVLVE